jgi:Aminotransferase class-III
MWGFPTARRGPGHRHDGQADGNGYPLARLAARPDPVDSFGERARYFNTFAGSPVACAVGMAALDVLEDKGLIARAAELGARLLERLRPLAEHDFVRDVAAPPCSSRSRSPRARRGEQRALAAGQLCLRGAVSSANLQPVGVARRGLFWRVRTARIAFVARGGCSGACARPGSRSWSRPGATPSTYENSRFLPHAAAVPAVQIPPLGASRSANSGSCP